MFRLTLALCLLLSSCQREEQSRNLTTTFNAIQMTIPYQLTVGQVLTSDELVRVQEIVKGTFDDIDRLYNEWNEDSEISKLNRLRAGEKVRVSEELAHFLVMTERLVRLTEGRFDPTVAPMHKLWRDELEQGRLPSQVDIETTSAAVGWDKVHLIDGVFHKDHDLTSFHMSGLAKGYCVDLLVERLNEAGFPNVYFEWGGEIRASGRHPEGRDWRIFVSKLGSRDPAEAVAILPLINSSIATSGDYIHYWEVDGRRFSHIINPQTLQPIEVSDNSIATASVLAATCIEADAFATAAMLSKDAKEGQSWAEALRQRGLLSACWLVTRVVD